MKENQVCFSKNKIYDLDLKIIKITVHPLTGSKGIFCKDFDENLYQINTEFGSFDNAISKLSAGQYITMKAKFYKKDVSEKGNRLLFFLKELIAPEKLDEEVFV